MSEIKIQDIMNSLPYRLVAEKAGDYQATFHFEFKEDKEIRPYTVKIAAGTCEVQEGLEGEAACLIKSKAQTYIDLTLGKGNPQMAVMMGKVKVSNIPEMMKFAPLFSKFDSEKNYSS